MPLKTKQQPWLNSPLAPGLRRGPVVKIVRSQVRVSDGSPLVGWLGRYINVRRCGGLSIVLVKLNDPLELFMWRDGFLPVPGFYLVHVCV